MRPLQPGSNAAPALVAEANALWAAASQAVRRANRWSVNGTTAFPSASAPLFRKSRTSAMMMRDDLGHVRTVRCSIELRVLVQEPLRSSPQFRARVNRPADLKACVCKAARLRLHCLAFGALSCQRPQLKSPSRIRFPYVLPVHSVRASPRHHFRAECVLRWVAGGPPRSEPRSASPNLPINPTAYNSFRALPASPYAAHEAVAIEPHPLRFTLHLSFRRTSTGLRSLPRTHLLFGAGAVLRSSWCCHVRRRMPRPDDTPR